jgi:hypothetical protein
MKNHVTSLELSKRMKELGFPQRSIFGWCQNYTRKSGEYKKDSKPYIQYKGSHDYSAYLASELGEWLPNEKLMIDKDTNDYSLDLFGTERKERKFAGGFCGENLCDAMAEMLIYLAENKLINPKEL